MLEKKCFLIFQLPRILLRPNVVTDMKNSMYYGGLGNTNKNQNEKYMSKKNCKIHPPDLLFRVALH